MPLPQILRTAPRARTAPDTASRGAAIESFSVRTFVRHASAAAHITMLVVLCWALGSGMALAQVPLAQPNLELRLDGTVYAMATQPDGGAILGGEFQMVNGVPRNNIARLLPDGTLDPDWNPSANNTVYALAVDANGNIYVSGFFHQIGGQTRNRLAKISGSGTGIADPHWNPLPAPLSMTSSVQALAVDSDGMVYVAGNFTQIGGQSRQGIAKLSGSGSGAADPDWNPSASYSPSFGGIRVMTVDASGDVYVGGRFSHIGGQARSNIARLSGTGAGAADPDWNPSATSDVYALVVDTNGAIYAGGSFGNIGGQIRAGIARLSSVTGLADPSWNPEAFGSVKALALDVSGAVYAGGSFNYIGGQSRGSIAKLSGATGEADPAWDPSISGRFAGVNALLLQSDGAVLAGGFFTQAGGQPRHSFAVLGTDGAATGHPMDIGKLPLVSALAAQPDGGLIVGGEFYLAGIVNRRNLLRLLPDHTVDTVWNPMPDDRVNDLAVDSDGAVYAVGHFNQIGGKARNYIAKLSGSGTGEADPTWDPAPNNGVLGKIAVDDGGAVYVSGYFTHIGGQPRNQLAKLAGGGTGAADPDWDPSPNTTSPVRTLVVDADGSVYVGGDFINAQIGGQVRNRLAKLSGSGTGAADPNWNPAPNGAVYDLAVNANGDVYVAGYFSQIGGQSRSSIARLSGLGTGAADSNWNPLALNSFASEVAVDGDGAVYVTGDFTQMGGQPRARMAKLDAISGALDENWSPSPDNNVDALLVGNDAVFAGGSFLKIGGESRISLAALPKEGPEARLSTLTPSVGTLSPSFTSDGTIYSLTVVHAVSSIAFTPVALDPAATITVNGQLVASGAPSSLVSLIIGSNPVSILVTAEDGTAQREYTVDVTRLSAQPVALSVTIERMPDGFVAGSGEIRHYRITATNLGHQAAGDVQLTIPLPAGLTDVLWTCHAPAPCTPEQGQNAVAVAFVLGSGQSAHVDLSGEVVAGVAFVDLRASASSASTGISAQGNASEPANGIGVLKNGFED